MISLNPPIQEAYDRSLEQVGDHDPYAGSGFLGIRDVLKAHYLIADYFFDQGHGMGGIGPKSMDLLHSAMLRQHISYGGTVKWSTRYDVCATLFYGLIKGHPFHDANKRTALLSLIYHLDTLNLCPTISHRDLEEFAVDVANNQLAARRRFRELVQDTADDDDASVMYVSHFIRKNSRRIDKRHYTVTYKELKQILNKFGYDLQNPRHNSIDIVRIEERRKIFGLFGEKEKVDVRVAQIGFPNWTAQVGKGAIGTVRKTTNLTYDKGVDSQTFFKNADPISVLISRYKEPLRRLADR